MGDIQENRDAVGVAGSTGLWKHLQQADAASWGQGGELQDLQCMPGNLVAVPACPCSFREM